MPILHMETELVRSVGNQMQQTSASMQQQTQQLNNAVQNLANSWQGPSASIFMGEIQPTMQRLNQFANTGELLNQRLQQEVDEWEGVGGNFGGGYATTKVGFVTAKESASVTPDVVPDVKLSKGHWEFKPNDIIGYDPYAEWENADQKDLGKAMSALLEYLENNENLLKPPYKIDEGLDQRLRALAAGRGISYDEALTEYSKFVQLLKGEVPDATSRSDYWGSVQQLRFGKVVGDALDIDPVFGALLRPTGGLVGPGDSITKGGIDLHDTLIKGFDFAMGPGIDTQPLLYHGIYHDAAGFLLSEHGVGPGYEYIAPGLPDTLGDVSLGNLVGGPAGAISWPLLLEKFPELNGQETGITFWILMMQGQPAPKYSGGGAGGGGGSAW